MLKIANEIVVSKYSSPEIMIIISLLKKTNPIIIGINKNISQLKILVDKLLISSFLSSPIKKEICGINTTNSDDVIVFIM